LFLINASCTVWSIVIGITCIFIAFVFNCRREERDINIGSVTWRDLAKDKQRLDAIIASALKAGEQEGVVLTADEWESTIKRKVQNAVKLAKKPVREGEEQSS